MTTGRRLLAGGALLAVIAALVVISGVISIKASSGHLAVTSWLLDFAKRRSVDTRSLGLEVPPLDDPGLVPLGAAHYDRGCRPCHGAPGTPTPVVPSRMTPHPPDLGRQIGRWKPRELFYVVAHGIKFTGMPGWPEPERTDEAWAMVPFLQALPGLDAAGYAALVDGVGPSRPGASEAVDTAARRCEGCHLPPAPGRRATLVPSLAGQPLAYVTAALHAYASGERKSGIMRTVAASFEPGQRAIIAARVVARHEGAAQATGTRAADERTPLEGSSRGVIWRGIPDRDVPACASCHGPGIGDRDPRFPVLAGQSEAYLRWQLRLFVENRRGGSSYGEIMRAVARRLTPADIDEAARAYAALPRGRQ